MPGASAALVPLGKDLLEPIDGGASLFAAWLTHGVLIAEEADAPHCLVDVSYLEPFHGHEILTHFRVVEVLAEAFVDARTPDAAYGSYSTPRALKTASTGSA